MSESDSEKKKLFFVKSPGYATATAETFLKKRNFEVFSEMVIEKALNKIFEVQPDFIFFALDHLDPSIEELPKLAAQGCMAPCIPYITSSNRAATKKLNLYPMAYKLYPPISGPAIERMVVKSYKQAAEEEARLSGNQPKISTTTIIESSQKPKRERITFIKSHKDNKAIGGLESENDDDSLDDVQKLLNDQHKAFRNQSIRSKNSVLKQSQSTKLTPSKMGELKRTINSKVKSPLESLLNTLKESEYTENEDSTGSGYSQMSPTKQNDSSYSQHSAASSSLLQSGNTGDAYNPFLNGEPTEKKQGLLYDPNSSDSNKSNSEQNAGNKNNSLMSSSGENSSESFSMLAGKHSQHGQNSSYADIQTNIDPNDLPTRAYCMAIYSNDWCGYLIITTKAELEFSTVDIVFTDWVKTQFENFQEVEEYDYFELDNINHSMVEQLSEVADYFDTIKVNEHDLNVSFFSVDPAKMILELNDDEDLIKILTEDIPSDLKIDFSLHLHLPENKKYLLYTQAQKMLSNEQKERLLAKKIQTLYTSLDYEREYKKFLAEKNVKILYESLNKKLKSV